MKWPDEEERVVISHRIKAKCNIPNCIAVADGTLFPLTFEPQSIDAPDCHGRKFQYSLSVMIVNDDKKYIRYYLSGFPGCAHDNREFSNTLLAKRPADCFGTKCHLVLIRQWRTLTVWSLLTKPPKDMT